MSKRLTGSIAVAIALQATLALAAPRLSFTRKLPASHDLAPAEHIGVIYAIGDSTTVDEFVDTLVEHANRSGALRMENDVEANHHLADFASTRKEHPADAYLGVNEFACKGTERTAEGSEHDVDGGRIKRTHHWLDVLCTARIDVINGEGKRGLSFRVKGEGTSPRTTALTDEERGIAFLQAAHFAGVNAAEAITPRVVKESVELDPAAPSFEEAYAMITADRLPDARAIWEASTRRHRESASLYFDLGALAEGMGDVTAARRYFELALQLSPHDARYKSEMGLFLKRNKP